MSGIGSSPRSAGALLHSFGLIRFRKILTPEEFSVAAGGTLRLDLDAGGTVHIRGTGGSSVIVEYSATCKPGCDVTFEERGSGVIVHTDFKGKGRVTITASAAEAVQRRKGAIHRAIVDIGNNSSLALGGLHATPKGSAKPHLWRVERRRTARNDDRSGARP